MSTLRGKTVFLLALVLSACSGQPPELPPVPEVDTSQVLPAVRAQMEQARDVLEKSPDDASNNGDYAMVLHAYDRSLYSTNEPGFWRPAIRAGRTTKATCSSSLASSTSP